LTDNTKKKANLIIKLGILLFAVVIIVYKLNNKAHLIDFGNLIAGLPTSRVYLILALVFLLMLVNWILEAFKWKFLVESIQPISIWGAIESVFCGLTLAVFTPNRIGEYGGRVFFLAPRKRVFGAIAMGVGAIGQMVVTNVLGSVAILWFIEKHVQVSVPTYSGILIFAIIYCLFFLLLFFNIRLLLNILVRIAFLQKLKKFFKVLACYRKKKLFRVFIYSVLRFIVFTSQYCLIITLLIPEIDFFSMIMMVWILFFVQSALPSLDLFDVGVRALTATYFFSFITENEVAIIAATASIWLVNLIIPAILGCLFVFKFNFFGTKPN